jgi:hypothetical protein
MWHLVECSFYAIAALLRFYTAKTRNGHSRGIALLLIDTTTFWIEWCR